ncbi:MAG: isochorismate synthase [Melioribacteraceae bacterium]
MNFPKKIERILANYLKINQWDLKSIVIPINLNIKKICLDKLKGANEKILYWEKPSSEYSFLAISSLIFASSNKFDSSNILHNWNEFSNLSIPLLLKTKKFPINKNSNIWLSFSDADYIPNLLILQSHSKSYLIANFFNYSDYEKIIYLLELISVDKNESENEFIEPQNFEKIGVKEEDDFNDWEIKINDYLNHIKVGDIQKVVLSKFISIPIKNFDLDKIVTLLSKKYKDCYIFILFEENSIFFGASPEKLFSLKGRLLETEALAGSIARGTNKIMDEKLASELLNDNKNLAEHKNVVDYITENLAGFVDTIEIDIMPKIKKLNNIQHLWTPIKASVKNNVSVDELTNQLYPTSAICGYPKNKALKIISETEEYDRGLYSGLIGWYNHIDEADFCVAIRSGLIKDNSLYAFAGCGIVRGSDAESEYQETKLKLKPILSLFNHENSN